LDGDLLALARPWGGICHSRHEPRRIPEMGAYGRPLALREAGPAARSVLGQRNGGRRANKPGEEFQES